MDRDQYFVVLHKGEWKIKHNGRHSHPYDTQADAISSAIDAAHAARSRPGSFVPDTAKIRTRQLAD
jgi:hypothetical protein